MSRRRESGGLESEVLATLWAADKALTTAEVVDAIGGELAYNTVQTILARLHDKGAVVRENAGRAHAYSPVLDDAGLTANRMRAMLDRGANNTAVLTRFLGTLSAEEKETVSELLTPRRTAGGDS